MQKISANIASLVFILCLFCNCGLITKGTKQNININSNPPGARVTISPTGQKITTPNTISLKKNKNYVLKFEQEGYKPANASINKKIESSIMTLDLVSLIFGLVGVVAIPVDAATGAWNKLTPESINVTLERTDGAPISSTPTPVPVRIAAGGVKSKYESIIVPPHEGKKPYIAVMDLKGASGEETEKIAKSLSDPLRVEFQNTGYFKVLDRANMKTVLDEVGFQQSGCSANTCTVQAGRILGVQKIITGSIGKLGDNYIVTLQMVDVSTALVEKSVSETAFCETGDLIYLIGIAAKKLTIESIK